MATDRQIEANRKNALRSSGPKTDEGKARSRLNATTHGLTAEVDVEAGRTPEFADRRAKWAAEEKPVGELGNWAMDRAVAASLRIDRCERAFDDLVASTRQRAALAWSQDHEVEAAKIFARIGRDPGLAARQLMTSLAGVGLLLEAWLGLVAKLSDEGDWSEAERSRALDLMGVAVDLRSGRTVVDGPAEVDAVAFRLGVAMGEVERLETLRDEAFIPLDEWERGRAMAGDGALLSKSAKLILRYERDAWKRYRDSIAQVRQPGEIPPPAVEPPPPAPPTEVAAVEAEVVVDDLEGEAEDAWLDAMERQIDALCGARPLATERTQFAEVLVGPSGG